MVLPLLVLAAILSSAEPLGADWRSLDRGFELRKIVVTESPKTRGGEILVVRIDPRHWSLELATQSRNGAGSGMTVREWAEAEGFVLAVNAGMFDTDRSTHVGYLEFDGHVNSSRVNTYKSAAAFHPRIPADDPPFRIFDLEDPRTSIESIRERYSSVVQNLRLIARPGINRWGADSAESWVEVALGEDSAGRALILYSPDSFTMWEFNEALLGADLDIVAAQHLEGGYWIQLYLRVGDLELDLAGSQSIQATLVGSGSGAVPIPNVLGVRRR